MMGQWGRVGGLAGQTNRVRLAGSPSLLVSQCLWADRIYPDLKEDLVGAASWKEGGGREGRTEGRREGGVH